MCVTLALSHLGRMGRLIDLDSASACLARVLEIGCGPVPVVAMLAARRGARAWAVETHSLLLMLLSFLLLSKVGTG